MQRIVLVHRLNPPRHAARHDKSQPETPINIGGRNRPSTGLRGSPGGATGRGGPAPHKSRPWRTWLRMEIQYRWNGEWWGRSMPGGSVGIVGVVLVSLASGRGASYRCCLWRRRRPLVYRGRVVLVFEQGNGLRLLRTLDLDLARWHRCSVVTYVGSCGGCICPAPDDARSAKKMATSSSR